MQQQAAQFTGQQIAVDNIVRSIMADLLKIEISLLDPESQITDFGVDSIVAAEFIGRINAKFKIKIPPTVLYDFRSLGQFSRYLNDTFDRAIARNLAVTPAPTPQLRQMPVLAPEAKMAEDRAPSKYAADFARLWEHAEQKISKAGSVKMPVIGGSRALDQVLIQSDSCLNIDCRLAGRGPAILMFSGLLADHCSWEKQIAELSKDHLLVIINTPGIGLSEMKPDQMSLPSVVADAARVLDVLRVNQPVVVMGNSFGGLLALTYCSTYPNDTRALILSNSVSYMTTAATSFSNFLDEVENVPDYLERVVSRANLSLLPVYRKMALDWSALIGTSFSNVKVPSLVIYGDQDKSADQSQIQQMSNNSMTRIRVIPGAGHLSNWTHARQFNREVHDFLKVPEYSSESKI